MVYSLFHLRTITFLAISFLLESFILEEELTMKKVAVVTKEGAVCFYALHFLFSNKYDVRAVTL